MLDDFLKKESLAGAVLVLAAVCALVIDNTALSPLYEGIRQIPITISVGEFGLSKPLLLWINDGLMAVFFLLVGLEIKREFLVGELSNRDSAVLPLIAAAGGIVVPALIFVAINWNEPELLPGWAIPAATDIAFALAVLSLVGTRAPVALKAFLLAVAIIDDIAAILIIAFAYTAQLSGEALWLAGLAVIALFALNRFGVRRIAAYVLVGVFLWICVLKSGVHATLAGVIVALAVPLRPNGHGEENPAGALEHMLHPWVALAILPAFAFSNAGVSLAGLSPAALLSPLPLGIALGLVVGKQIGVFGATWLAVRTGISALPRGVTFWHIYGVSLLCGIGFTMSLFIGTLAFEGPPHDAGVRLGVIFGSLVSAALGLIVLAAQKPQPQLAAAS